MNKFKEPIFITRPILPSREDFDKCLDSVFSSKWLTNHGNKHDLLEERLKNILKVKNVSVFNNGTIALLTALKTMNLPIGSEVITTPFTFAATPHAISWNNLNPVFCDIEPDTMTINADKIEEHITENTSAILPVHVYGFPCDVDKIGKIAKENNLKVIYDGAHVFSTEINNKGIGNYGDITMFSFHATKLFNTIEGGCLTYNDNNLKEKIYNLRNFGIQDEDNVVDIGINGKMNEIIASIGLLNLKIFEDEKNKRLNIRNRYSENFKNVDGIRIPQYPKNASFSGQYFPIIFEDDFPLSRDEVYCNLKRHNVFSRKYFYPLCSDFEPYKFLPSSSHSNLPVANDIKNKVLCLPFYGELKLNDVDLICDIIKY